MRHELACLFVNGIGVDQDFADIRMVVITDGANHQTAFLINQEGAFLRVGGFLDGMPQLQQVVQVPLQFFLIAANTSGAADDAHALRYLELVHGVAQFVAVFAFNTARHTATARVVGHEDDVASGQADEGGERCALGAALVFFYLDDDFLAFVQRILDTGLADIDAGAEISPRHFLERQEPVTVSTVFHEAGFEAGFDAGDDTLVDIAFLLFLASRFDVEINQFLAIDDRNPEFLGLGCIK